METGCWTELLERISQSMVFGVNTPVTDDVAKPPPSFLSPGLGSFSKKFKELDLKRHRKHLQHLLRSMHQEILIYKEIKGDY